MISFAPAIRALGLALGMCVADLPAAAVETWEISPSERRHVARATFLPEQLDRIRGTEFGTPGDVVRQFRGGFDAEQPPTLGFRLKGLDLVDGVLYAGGATRHLRPRAHAWPAFRVPTEVTRGALYESWVGNRWFGNWLQDDCLTYRLAEAAGEPVTTTLATAGHVPDYERRLGMQPRRLGRVHFDELVVFADHGQNASRRQRAADFRLRVAGAPPPVRHAGVFLLRGGTGETRRLANEPAIAAHLAHRRGFQVIDPSHAPLGEIVAACAGADVVAGVEGSHLVHGMMLMPPDATLLVLQPPTRVVSVLKSMTDLNGQGYAFVVGTGDAQTFEVDVGEVERTLDLALRAAGVTSL